MSTSATTLERDMLRTRVPERDMSVTTFLHQRFGPDVRHPWTAVWAYPRGGPYAALVWLHFWQGPTSVGGLDEAHESVVDRVKRGEIPAQREEQAEAEEERCASTSQGQ